jgi:membrane-associated phospholipid phosphatase
VPASITVGVVFFVYLGVAACFKDMPGWRRHRLGLTGTGLTLAGVALAASPRTEWREHALNWLPGLYLLIGYWLPAQLPARAAPRLARWLLETDRRVFAAGLNRAVERAPRLVLEYLESAYLCCYVVVPVGLAWLYVAGESREANRFWTAVLAAALPCYALLPWFETRPPRAVAAQSSIDRRGLLVRRANLRVLNTASVGANTFPSGHAAASLAAALCVAAATPAAGAVFAVIACSIAAGSVIGRYHYALDALFGMAAALAGFLVSRAV